MKKIIITILILIMSASVSLIAQPIDKSIKWYDVGSQQFKVQPIPFIPMDSTLAANVTTPTAGNGNIFLGLDRKMYAKWVGGTVTEIGGGTGGANTTLSNLTSPTAINQNLNYRAGKMAIFLDATNTGAMGIYNSNTLGHLDFVYDVGGGSEGVRMSLRGDGINTTSLLPFSNASYDVGTTGMRYRNAYFSGNVTGTWAGSAIGPSVGGTGLTGAGSLHSTLVNITGSGWTAKVNYYNGTLQAAGDTAFIAVSGLESVGKAVANWGVVGGTNVPLGVLYIKEIGNGYVRVRSNADEQVNLPIIVTITEWVN